MENLFYNSFSDQKNILISETIFMMMCWTKFLSYLCSSICFNIFVIMQPDSFSEKNKHLQKCAKHRLRCSFWQTSRLCAQQHKTDEHHSSGRKTECICEEDSPRHTRTNTIKFWVTWEMLLPTSQIFLQLHPERGKCAGVGWGLLALMLWNETLLHLVSEQVQLPPIAPSTYTHPSVSAKRSLGCVTLSHRRVTLRKRN